MRLLRVWMLMLLSLGAICPSLAAEEKVKTILDFRQELELKTDQEEAISRELSQLRQNSKASRQKALQLSGEAKSLIDKEAPLESIRAKLQELANLQVESQMLDLATVRKLNKLLTPAQLEQWTAIRAREKSKKKT